MQQASEHGSTDLRDRARLEMAAQGLRTTFDQMSIEQVDKAKEMASGDLLKLAPSETKDLRKLLWSSVDNKESKDLDQIEYAERLSDGNARVLIGIADVDIYVPKDTAIDNAARANTTSVYTGVLTFPMLPDEISCGLSSLLPGQDRLAVVYELLISPDGHVLQSQVYRALTHNYAKLDYKTIGDWLDGLTDVPTQVSRVPGLAEQIKLQVAIKEQIFGLRKQRGSLFLGSVEARPVTSDGVVLELELEEDNPAKELIENLMIAANIAVSEYLDKKNFPSIKRVVRSPDRWDKLVQLVKGMGGSLPDKPDARALQLFLMEQRQKDPRHFPDVSLRVVKLLGGGSYELDPPGQNNTGHFALAVNDYTHSTAPNRRYVDLITQRLLKAAMDGKPVPYTDEELTEIAAKCNRQSAAAKKVERTMRKVAAASLLEHSIGRIYDGIVTGIKNSAVYVRVVRPPVEGRIVKGQEKLDVGDDVRVRLIKVDEAHAYIDFELI